MKKQYTLAVGVLLGILVLSVCVLWKTPDRHRRASSEEQASAVIPAADVGSTSQAKKKDCGCCAERMTRIKEMIRRARKRKQSLSKSVGDPPRTNAAKK